MLNGAWPTSSVINLNPGISLPHTRLFSLWNKFLLTMPLHCNPFLQTMTMSDAMLLRFLTDYNMPLTKVCSHCLATCHVHWQEMQNTSLHCTLHCTSLYTCFYLHACFYLWRSFMNPALLSAFKYVGYYRISQQILLGGGWAQVQNTGFTQCNLPYICPGILHCNIIIIWFQW